MYETEYNGRKYCFYDDHMTIDGVSIQYDRMKDVGHRGGDQPAFVFSYGDRRFSMSYPPEELEKILPYLKKASDASPQEEPAEKLLADTAEDLLQTTVDPENADDTLETPEEPRDTTDNEPRTSRKKVVIICAAVVLAIILIIAAVVVFSGFSKQSSKHVIGSSTPVPMNEDATQKYSEIKSDADPQDFALDYYSKYFQDGDTTHWIINKQEATTTGITDNGDGTITVRVHEYVDGEENSAETIGKGEVWEEYTIDIASGDNLDME